MENTGENTGEAAPAEKPPELRPQEHGGALQTGNPGNKGGTGRPPNALREWAVDVLTEEGRERILRVLRSADDEMALKAFKELRQLGVGSKVEVDAPASPLVVGVTVGPAVAAERKEAGDGVG